MTSLMLFTPRTGMCIPHLYRTSCFKSQFTPSPSAFFLFIISMVCYNRMCVRDNDGHTRCVYTPVPHLGLTSASTCLVYMHVTELHVCKCTTWYSKRFFVINTTLTCIIQMIILLCENFLYICTRRSKS